MDNDTGRPRTMAASAVRGINQFRENARRWRAALKREKQRRAAVFAVHARSPPPPRPLRRFFEIGRRGRGGGNTVHTSTSFEREYFEYFVAKNRLLSLMLLGCWGERGCFFEGKIVSMNCFESNVHGYYILVFIRYSLQDNLLLYLKILTRAV